VNEVGWKSAGITPPGGAGAVVVVLELVVRVVRVVEVAEDVDVVEDVVVLPQAAPAKVSAATATPTSARANPSRSLGL
jgi:hypothetical protein